MRRADPPGRPDPAAGTATGANAATGTRILILAPFPPDSEGTHGGSRAIAHLVEALAEDHRIVLAYLRASDELPIGDRLADLCDEVVEGRRGGSTRSSVLPLSTGSLPGLAARLLAGDPLWAAGRWSPRFAERLRESISRWRPDVIQAEFSVMGQYLPTRSSSDAAQVVTFHEPSASAAAERASAASGLDAVAWSLEARRWRAFERRLLQRIDAGVAFTPRDATELRRLTDGGNAPADGVHGTQGGNAKPHVETIPLGVALPPEPSVERGEDHPSPPRVVFVGNYVHPPNEDAARHLIEEILPLLRRRAGAVQLTLVGPGAPSSLVARGGDGIVFTGAVPDVAAVLQAADVVVAPLRRGGGMRVKVLEAMAAGRAVVATPLAVEGIAVTSGREVIVAADPDDFAEEVAALLRDPARRRRLGAAARAFVGRHHSWKGTAEAYASLHHHVLRNRVRDPRFR